MATVFVDRMYRETLRLLEDARDYLLHWEKRDRAGASLGTRLVISRECMLMTARLTSVMSWVLVQKAVEAGEISDDEAILDENRLLVREVHVRPLPAGPGPLSARLWTMLERSNRLFQRVRRLDDMVTGRRAF
ncbi:MAG: DUF1465 family protein [Alphaproteobacteria bacterium]|nr:DUF1465 family protein [Alphaproteobacteria bacterium]